MFVQAAPTQIKRSRRFEVEKDGNSVVVEREVAYATLFWDDLTRCALQQPPQAPRCIQWDEDGDPLWRISAEAQAPVCADCSSVFVCLPMAIQILLRVLATGPACDINCSQCY